MSADLLLMALPANPDHLARNIWERLQGYGWADDGDYSDADRQPLVSWEEYAGLWSTLTEFPNVEVGQVSWAKAVTMEDWVRYVPPAVQRTVDLIGDGTILTLGLAKEITVAFNLPNPSIYGRGVAKGRTVKRFLQANLGCYLVHTSV